jgi:hypothetical protein
MQCPEARHHAAHGKGGKDEPKQATETPPYHPRRELVSPGVNPALPIEGVKEARQPMVIRDES